MSGKFIVLHNCHHTGKEYVDAVYTYHDEQDRPRQEAKSRVLAINMSGFVREVVDADWQAAVS